MECDSVKLTMLLKIAGAIYLMHGASSSARVVESILDSQNIPIDSDSQNIPVNSDSQAANVSDESFGLEEYNITEENASVSDSWTSNDTLKSEQDNTSVSMDPVSIPMNRLPKDPLTKSPIGSNSSKTTIDDKQVPEPSDNRQPSPAVSNASAPQNLMNRLDILRKQRQSRLAQRLSHLSQVFPSRLGQGVRALPEVTKEKKQRALAYLARQNILSHLRLPTVNEQHCYRAVCGLPYGTHSRLWNDVTQPGLRLFFQVPKINRRLAKRKTVKGARLKLFVKPRPDCTCSDESNESTSLLVSVYQFLRPLSYRKNNRVVYRRKLLSFFKVPKDGNVFVALNVTSAVKTWMMRSRKNFGLEVTVQDASKTFLPAKDIIALQYCGETTDSCRDDDGKQIEHVQWYRHPLGPEPQPSDTSPYLDVVTSQQTDSLFDKYTLRQRRSVRQFDLSHLKLMLRPRPRPNRNLGLMLARQLALKRQEARLLRQRGNRPSNEPRDSRKKNRRPIIRLQFDVDETLRRPSAPVQRPPPANSRPYSCQCPDRTTRPSTSMTTTATESHVSIQTKLSSRTDTRLQDSRVENETDHTNNDSLGVSQTDVDSDILYSNNSKNSSTQDVSSNSSSHAVTDTSTNDVDWKAIFEKMHRREPLCDPKIVNIPIKDKSVIAPRHYLTIECPRNCKICQGELCVRQTCEPSSFSPVPVFLLTSSSKIVSGHLEGHLKVTACRC